MTADEMTHGIDKCEIDINDKKAIAVTLLHKSIVAIELAFNDQLTDINGKRSLMGMYLNDAKLLFNLCIDKTMDEIKFND